MPVVSGERAFEFEMDRVQLRHAKSSPHMIVDLHRDARHSCRFLAVSLGEWPHEVVPVGRRDVQLLDYTLSERGVDLTQSGRRTDTGRIAREIAQHGYAFFVELEAVSTGGEPADDAVAPVGAAVQAAALLRRAQMLLAAAQACREEASGLGRSWSDDLDGLAAALKLERMTQGLLDRAADFAAGGDWTRGAAAAG